MITLWFHAKVHISVVLITLTISATPFVKAAQSAKKATLPDKWVIGLKAASKDSGTQEVIKTKCFEKSDVAVEISALKSGLHRDVETLVRVAVTTEVPASCHLMQLQTIPSGAFIDVYKIKSKLRDNTIKVFLVDTINTEKPEYLSPKHSIIVYSKLNQTSDALESRTILPVDLRYHRPSSDPAVHYTTTVIPNPYFLLHCPGAEVGESREKSASKCGPSFQSKCPENDNALCEWELLSYSNDDTEISLAVPVGNQQHTLLVTSITMVTTILGSVVLIAAILMSPKSVSKRYKD
ncbi:phosphatidylinositol-glycan biosynthesis class X protein-like [Ptychodera flava]|uniref:phosphatidylinositol-glycan biosynthesis class X protein-like n=1 Tax=Ptychodera flava TaxID=63121 RepID=UPI00396A5750